MVGIHRGPLADQHVGVGAGRPPAAEIFRRLAAGNPVTFEPALSRALTAWAVLLATEGDVSEALRATGEAVECSRPRVAAMPFLLQLLHLALGLRVQLLDALWCPQDAAAT